MVAAVDFDGVLNDISNHPNFGEPLQDAQYALKKLQRMGYDIVIFSARATDTNIKSTMAEWLAKHRMPFTDITNVKPPDTALIIDDKAIRFTNWIDVLAEVRRVRA